MDDDTTTKEVQSFLLCQCRSIWIVSNECLVFSAVVGCAFATWVVVDDSSGRSLSVATTTRLILLLLSVPITATVFWFLLQLGIRLENLAMTDELDDDTVVDRNLAHTLPAVAVFELSFVITAAVSMVSASGLLGYATD